MMTSQQAMAYGSQIEKQVKARTSHQAVIEKSTKKKNKSKGIAKGIGTVLAATVIGVGLFSYGAYSVYELTTYPSRR